MNTDKLVEKIGVLNKKQPWNHSIELSPGVFTCSPDQSSAGKNLVKWKRIEPFINSFSCSGKRVLDIGCNDGFFSLKLAELGANVVALEASNERVEKAQFVFNQRNVSNQIRLINASVYDFQLDTLGSFDLVICMGFIHRVPDPYTLLSILAPLSDTFLLEFKAFQEYAYDRPYLMFDGRRSDPGDQWSICYFIPSVRAVLTMLEQLKIEHSGIIGDPTSRRVMLVSSKKELPILKSLNRIDKANKLYLLKKFIRRFIADVLRTIRGQWRIC